MSHDAKKPRQSISISTYPIVKLTNGELVNALDSLDNYNHTKRGSYSGMERIIGQDGVEELKLHRHRKHQRSKNRDKQK